MRVQVGIALTVTAFSLGACQASTGGTASLETDDQKASYGIGLNMGGQLGPAESHIDMDALVAGLMDGMEGSDSRVPDDELQVVLQAFSSTIQAEEAARSEAEAAENAAEGETFLAENASKEGVMVTESGLQYEILRAGEGAKPTGIDRVSIHYKGTLLDGTEFDSSYGRGEPAVFGVGGVIPGFAEGLQLMSPGGHYRFVIPAGLAYGPQGSAGSIGPNATIVFEVEMLEIVQ